MDQSLETTEFEKNALVNEYSVWHKILQARGNEPDSAEKGSINLRYSFAFDRRNDQEAKFTADDIRVEGLIEPLEDYIYRPSDPERIFLKTEEGESWIQITIDPKDTYRPKMAMFTAKGKDYYMAEGLIISLSSHGRAFQHSWWGGVLEPDLHPIQDPSIGYLKKYPRSIEQITKFDEDQSGIFIEPLSPLTGQNFERLGFLLTQIQNNNIIESEY